MASIRSQVEDDVRLTGQLGAVDQAARRLQVALQGSTAADSERPAIDRHRRELSQAAETVRSIRPASGTIARQTATIAAAAEDLSRAAEMEPRNHSALAASANQVIDAARGATLEVRTDLSGLSMALARKWSQLYFVAVSVAVLGVALAVLLASTSGRCAKCGSCAAFCRCARTANGSATTKTTGNRSRDTYRAARPPNSVTASARSAMRR